MTLSKKTRKKIIHSIWLAKGITKMVLFFVSMLLLIWLAWSFLEVQIHNFTMLSDNPYEYCSFNLFKLMLEWF